MSDLLDAQLLQVVASCIPVEQIVRSPLEGAAHGRGEDLDGGVRRLLQPCSDRLANPLPVLGQRQIARTKLEAVDDGRVERLCDVVSRVLARDVSGDKPKTI